MPYDPSPYLFPAFLYGSRAGAVRGWRKALRMAFDSGAWSGILLEDRRDVRDDSSAIVIAGDNRRRSPTPIWNVGVVTSLELWQQLPYNADKQDRLLTQAFDTLWFCIAALGSNLLCSEPTDLLLGAIVRSVVHWLPETMALQDRFSIGTPSIREPECLSSARRSWQLNLIRYMQRSFPEAIAQDATATVLAKIEEAESRRYEALRALIHSRKLQNPKRGLPPAVQYLLEHGLIIEERERFRLPESLQSRLG